MELVRMICIRFARCMKKSPPFPEESGQRYEQSRALDLQRLEFLFEVASSPAGIAVEMRGIAIDDGHLAAAL